MKRKLTHQIKSSTVATVSEKFQDFMGVQFKKVSEKLDRHSVTLDKHSGILDQHSKVLEAMLKEMRKNSEEAREHRMMMSALNHSDIAQERRIKGLEIRIEKLEQKNS